jgi:outer membrane protein assembly factor BamB
VRWRVQLPTSVKAQPRPHGDRLYVAGVDGKLYALRLADGVTQWTFAAGAEILGSPVATDDAVLFGTGDGTFYALDLNGKEKWKYAAGAAVYSSPVLHEGKVVFGDNAGFVHALDASSGEKKWQFAKAGYSIESQLHAGTERIYFGAWDEMVYALDAKTGKVVWRSRAKGPTERKAAQRYYSPADCGPVFCGGKIFCADRDYKLSIMDSEGALRSGLIDVVATGLATDGLSVLVRRAGALARLNGEGAVQWSVEVALGTVAAPPVEEKGIVYACSSTGLLVAVDLSTGKMLWQRQVTPRLYVLAAPAAKEHQVFVAGMDGSITCVATK